MDQRRLQNQSLPLKLRNHVLQTDREFNRISPSIALRIGLARRWSRAYRRAIRQSINDLTEIGGLHLGKSEGMPDLDDRQIDAIIWLLHAGIRKVLNFKTDVKIVFKDVTDANMVAELHIARQDVLIVVIRIRE